MFCVIVENITMFKVFKKRIFHIRFKVLTDNFEIRIGRQLEILKSSLSSPPGQRDERSYLQLQISSLL